MEYQRAVPEIQWGDSNQEGDVLLIGLKADHPLRHTLLIDRAVLNDAFGSSDSDLIGLARSHQEEVTVAVAKAWQEEREQELREIYSGQGFVRLALELSDFQ